METIKIVHRLDQSCAMEELLVNGKWVGGGNEWDNHCKDRLDGLIKAFKIIGVDFEVVRDYDWKYE